MSNETADNSNSLAAKEEYSKVADESVVHARIAKALSADYTFIYYVNTDTDRYIDYSYDACEMICASFKRSPIFRIGGDEFAVIAQGVSYEHLDEQIEAISKKNQKNKENGKVTVAFGFSRFHHDKSVEEVFIRADELMYENKRKMKASQS